MKGRENDAAPGDSAGAADNAYEFCVRGRLSTRWAALFDGLTLTPHDGNTVISGTVPDQAALHALLRQIGDLGLEIISVVRAPPGADGPASTHDTSSPDTTQGEPQ